MKMTLVVNCLQLNFWMFFSDFSPTRWGHVGGLNPTHVTPYQAESLSCDNTRKNLLARIEIPKQSKIIAPYDTYLSKSIFLKIYVCDKYLWDSSKLIMMGTGSWAWKSTPTCWENSRSPSLRWLLCIYWCRQVSWFLALIISKLAWDWFGKNAGTANPKLR